MQPIITDGIDGRSLKIVSRGEMAEPIEMPFWLWTLMGPRNHVLDGGL